MPLGYIVFIYIQYSHFLQYLHMAPYGMVGVRELRSKALLPYAEITIINVI